MKVNSVKVFIRKYLNRNKKSRIRIGSITEMLKGMIIKYKRIVILKYLT